MSKILDIAHEMAKDLFEVGAMDEVTMRTVESLCLPEKKIFLPEDIRRIRTTNHLSQPVFALMLGIGKTGSSRNLMEKKFHITAPLDCHIQFPTVKEDSCSIAFEASKPSGSRL